MKDFWFDMISLKIPKIIHKFFVTSTTLRAEMKKYQQFQSQ